MTAGTTSLVSFTDLDSLPDNGFIATGSATVGGQKRIIAVKFDVDGKVEWSQVYTLGTGRSIFVSTGGGNAFIAGSNKLLRIRTSSGEAVWEGCCHVVRCFIDRDIRPSTAAIRHPCIR